MNFKTVFTFAFLACASLLSFTAVEAASFSLNFGTAPAPRTYVVQRQAPVQRVIVQQAPRVVIQQAPVEIATLRAAPAPAPVPVAPVTVYSAPTPYYQEVREVVVVPKRPVFRTGFSFGWFFR